MTTIEQLHDDYRFAKANGDEEDCRRILAKTLAFRVQRVVERLYKYGPQFDSETSHQIGGMLGVALTIYPPDPPPADPRDDVVAAARIAVDVWNNPGRYSERTKSEAFAAVQTALNALTS